MKQSLDFTRKDSLNFLLEYPVERIAIIYTARNEKFSPFSLKTISTQDLFIPKQFQIIGYRSVFVPVINHVGQYVCAVEARDVFKFIKNSQTKQFPVSHSLPFHFIQENSSIQNLIECSDPLKNDNYILVQGKNDKIIGYIDPILKKLLDDPEFLFLFIKSLDHIDDGIVIVNHEGEISYVNQKYHEILNIPFYKIIGKKLYDIEPSAKIINTIKTGKKYFNEPLKINTINKDIVASICPIKRNNKIKAAISIFKDFERIELLNKKLNQYKELAIKLYEKLYKNKNSQVNIYNHYLIGENPQFMKCIQIASQIANTDAPVLITGESGTGKELFARFIHDLSDRKNHPFIALNCASIPDTLIESELFGYEEGAFTGAKKGGKVGKLFLAQNGTLFLDEIGEMSPGFQAKLLRVLQTGHFDPLGSVQEKYVNVRIISATNKDIYGMVANGTFRSDLFYRINVFHLHLPPLRERKEDILRLSVYFCDKFSKKYKKNLSLSDEIVSLLNSYSWPGNIRELENGIHHAVVLAKSNDFLYPWHLPDEIRITSHSLPPSSEISEFKDKKPTYKKFINQYEIDLFRGTLKNCKKIKDACALLHISRSTFYRKLKKFGLPGVRILKTKTGNPISL